jgi:hypothetical protein
MESPGAYLPLRPTVNHDPPLGNPCLPRKEHRGATPLTREELADLLREAERAHAEYERELGQRDEDWPSWYAGYIVERLEER